MRPERNLRLLFKAQEDFYADRPVMNLHNSNLTNVAALLVNEINELNGHAEDGMTLEKYREQEIADIVWFALGVCRQFGEFPNPAYLSGVVAEFGLTVPTVEWADPQPLSQDDEARYQSIKTELVSEAQTLQNINTRRHLLLMSEGEQTGTVHHLHRVLGLSWALFSLLGVNPIDATIEKMARNHAKHTANLYQDTSRTYPQARDEADRLWKQAHGNRIFYGSDETEDAIR